MMVLPPLLFTGHPYVDQVLCLVFGLNDLIAEWLHLPEHFKGTKDVVTATLSIETEVAIDDICQLCRKVFKRHTFMIPDDGKYCSTRLRHQHCQRQSVWPPRTQRGRRCCAPRTRPHCRPWPVRAPLADLSDSAGVGSGAACCRSARAAAVASAVCSSGHVLA